MENIRGSLLSILTEYVDPKINPLSLPDSTTMEALEIGESPIGTGEFLQLQRDIETQFGITFAPNELPDQKNLPQMTLGEIVSAIQNKLS